MRTSIEMWEGDGAAHKLAAPIAVPITEAHHTLGIGVLYAITIVGILAVVAKLH
jgi:uncharacterized membrane protein